LYLERSWGLQCGGRSGRADLHILGRNPEQTNEKKRKVKETRRERQKERMRKRKEDILQ
jgi:hypothetical protein